MLKPSLNLGVIYKWYNAKMALMAFLSPYPPYITLYTQEFMDDPLGVYTVPFDKRQTPLNFNRFVSRIIWCHFNHEKFLQILMIRYSTCTSPRPWRGVEFLVAADCLYQFTRGRHQGTMAKPMALNATAEITDSQQDAQLSQRDRAARCINFGQKWKTETGRQYFTDIIGLFSTTLT